MYAHELRQSEETFQMKKIDFKLKLLSTFNDKRRHLEYEHQNVNIRHRQNSDNDQYLLNGINNHINDPNSYDGHNHPSNESIQQQQQQQRPTYNLRRAAANEIIPENSITSLKDLSILKKNHLKIQLMIQQQNLLLMFVLKMVVYGINEHGFHVIHQYF
jgi:hypothetical protein